MKSCSYCGMESDEATAVCAGCGKEFTAITTTTAPVDPVLLDPEEDLVVLARCRTVVEANMLKLRLESAGVEACVPEELNPQMFWYAVPSPLEEVTVRVRARDFAAAREVLTDPGLAIPPTAPPPPPPPPPPIPPPPPARTLN